MMPSTLLYLCSDCSSWAIFLVTWMTVTTWKVATWCVRSSFVSDEKVVHQRAYGALLLWGWKSQAHLKVQQPCLYHGLVSYPWEIMRIMGSGVLACFGEVSSIGISLQYSYPKDCHQAQVFQTSRSNCIGVVGCVIWVLFNSLYWKPGPVDAAKADATASVTALTGNWVVWRSERENLH